MNDMSLMNRESKKRRLRQQIVDPQLTDMEEDQEGFVRDVRLRARKRWIWIAIVAVMIISIAAIAFFQLKKHYQYTRYEVLWEKELKEGSFVGYINFENNVIKYSKDGASYIDAQGREVWAKSFELKSPIAYVNGGYAAIADQQGNHIYIFDKTGNVGEATTLLPILKISISGYGVVSAILEDSTANYISMYRKDGTALDVMIKALLNGESGYPVDLSLSPDGTQMMESYIYFKNGTVNSRVAFHNFSEVGKNMPNRLVGGFHEAYDGTLVSRVRFLTETYSCAFADNSISFFSSRNVASPQLIKHQEVEEEIKSVLYSNQYAGVIVALPSGENSARMDIYKANGDMVFSHEFDYSYTRAHIDGDLVILYNEDSCKVYNMNGIEKFSGQFDFPVSIVRKGRYFNTLIVTGPQNMKEIKLK